MDLIDILKWKVLEREDKIDKRVMENTSLDVTEYPLAAFTGDNWLEYDNVYCINRINPIYEEDADYTDQILSKHSTLNRTTSFSSGYESIQGLIPPPVWPRTKEGSFPGPEIAKYKQACDHVQESLDTNSDAYQSIVTSSVFLSGNNIKYKSDKRTENMTRSREGMGKVIKELKKALCSSKRVSSIQKSTPWGHLNKNRRAFRDSITNRTYAICKGKKRCQRNDNKSKPNYQSEDIKTPGYDNRNMSMRSITSTLQLSREHLTTDQDNQTYSDHKINIIKELSPQHPLINNEGSWSSSSWSLRGQDKWMARTELDCHGYTYTKLGHFYINLRRRTRNIQRRQKELIGFFFKFFESLCFPLLVVSLIFIFVIVCVFLLKRTQMAD